MGEAADNMELAVEFAKEEFAVIRTGRANPNIFAKLTVDYYGTRTPLQQLASFQVPEARMILITPYDKATLAAIEKALRESDLGLNPSNDGNLIRIVLPTLTEERRKDFIKIARSKAEDARVSVRNARRDAKTAIDKLVKSKEIGEDEAVRAEKKLDGLTKQHTDAIDLALSGKEAELLEV